VATGPVAQLEGVRRTPRAADAMWNAVTTTYRPLAQSRPQRRSVSDHGARRGRGGWAGPAGARWNGGGASTDQCRRGRSAKGAARRLADEFQKGPAAARRGPPVAGVRVDNRVW